MEARIRIVEYDPEWPDRYETERRQIASALGPLALAIEHVGSTAVPGLPAKPVIDLMVAVANLDAVAACIPPLATLGYEYSPEYESTVPERRFFQKGPVEARSYHLHVVELDSWFWKRLLLFRDYLRAHPDVAHEYVRLKRLLADLHGTDRRAYSDAKTTFVREVEGRARTESGE